MSLNLFNRSLSWLAPALNLQEPALPTQLDTARVVPTLDILQGGWATAQWRLGTQNHPSSTAGSVETIAAEMEDRTSIIIAAHISHFGGAGAANVYLRFYDPVRALFAYVARPSIPAATTWGWAEITGGLQPLIVPPGHRLEVVWPTTAVGESFELFHLTATISGRVKPI